MNVVKEMWRNLPARHRLILVVLLALVLLALLLKSCAGHSGTVQVAAPPLPVPPAPSPSLSTSLSPSQQGAAGGAPTTANGDLKLATRRPLLTSPGLQFVGGTSAAQAAKEPQQPSKQKSQQQSSQQSSQQQPKQPSPSHAPSHAPEVASPKPGHKVVKTAGNTPPSTSGKNAGLFAALPADAWLLQVAAAPNETEARARCKSLSLPCVSYTAQRQGRQVWILVVGPYASRDAALAAVAKLPMALQQQGPFARQVGDVRRDAGN